MCGVTGFWRRDGTPERAEAEAALRRMTDTLRHRGPDDEGGWLDPETGIALGHRRLSILDLSPAGRQPMASSDGRWRVSFNGEIYNFAELRRRLQAEGGEFRSDCDTEVLVEAVARWGPRGAVGRFRGMFAFALWDARERELWLVRDRMGEKPLYWGWMGPVLLFGSELKALRAHPAWRGEVDRDALALYLRHQYVPAPWSIWRGVRKLPPAHLARFRGEPGAEPELEAYWSVLREAEEPGLGGERVPEAGLAEQLDALLRRVIRDELVSDVPLGAFLSGGVDSSLIVALMQEESARPVRTFTIGFPERERDEAGHAARVAAHLGTDHTELYVDGRDALEVVPELPRIWDEPFSDSSQIPTHLLASLTRNHVTVSLSGDGGDELFGGYGRYERARRMWSAARSLPDPARRAAARAVGTAGAVAWSGVVRPLERFLPDALRGELKRERLDGLCGLLEAGQPEEFYRHLISHWCRPEEVVVQGTEPATAFTRPARWSGLDDVGARLMYLDMITYLPDDILVKVDRATMAVGLESRAPFLDHLVVEFAWRLAPAMKIRDGRGKWILRRLLERYVPPAITQRPKQGFGVPLDGWLRGPLREWGEGLLGERRLREEGFLRPEPVRRRWREHQEGVRDWSYHLWDVLVFQAWLAEQRASGGDSR